MESKGTPSFWKLLMEDDLNHGIRILKSFSDELEKRKSPCNYSLVTGENSRSSDRSCSWKAKLVKKGHYCYVCKKSWPLFVKDYNLKYGDYLLFHLIGKATFFVTPYGPNGSKKMLNNDDDDDDSDTSESESDEDDHEDARVSKKPPTESKNIFSSPASKKLKKSGGCDDYSTRKSDSDSTFIVDDADHHQVKKSDELGGTSSSGEHGYNKDGDADSRKETDEMDGYYDSSAEKPYLIRTMKEHYKSRMVIPSLFARKVILDKAAREIELRWEDGAHEKTLTAEMVQRNDGRVDIGKGWNEFRKQFDLKVGETYRFVIVNRRDPVTMSVHKYTPNDQRN